jgi:hypothetical protein
MLARTVEYTISRPELDGHLCWPNMSEIIAAMEAYSESFQLPWCSARSAEATKTTHVHDSLPEPAKKDSRVSAHRHFDASAPLVGVEVGNGEALANFTVHQPVLCRSSGYLQARLKTCWARDEHVRLPEQDAEAFGLYVNWLYRDALPILQHEEENMSSRCGDDAAETPLAVDWLLLAEAYVLGEALLDPTFQTAVLDAMVLVSSSEAARQVMWQLLPNLADVIYEGTALSSPARVWLLGIVKKHMPLEIVTKMKHELPEEFIQVLASTNDA